MKKKIFLIFILIATLFLSACASDEYYDDHQGTSALKYDYTEDEDGYVLYLNSVSVSSDEEIDGVYCALPDTITGDLVLPSHYNGKPITKIVGYSYSRLYDGNVTRLIVPDTVKEISNSLIDRFCNTIEEVVLPEGLEIVGSRAFDRNSNYDRLLKINVPSSIKQIGYGAFDYCYIDKIDFLNLTDCDRSAFYCCTIGDVEFSNSSKLGNNIFNGSKVNNIHFSKEFNQISPYAFSYCSIKNIYIPSSINFIGTGAFSSSRVERVEFEDGLTTIPEGCFLGCGSLKEVKLPSTLTHIEKEAFKECTSLETIDLPDSLECIRENAFAGTNLKTIFLPRKLKYIEESAFACSSLTELEIPDNVTTIGDNAFSGCSGLFEVKLGNGITSMGDGVFSDCNNLITATISEGVSSLSETMFSGCGSLREVYNLSPIDKEFVQTTIKVMHRTKDEESIIKRDGDNYFSVINNEVYLLKTRTIDDVITLPASLTYNGNTYNYSLDDNLFNGVSAAKLVLSNGITHIEEGAFLGAEIETLEFPKGYTDIEAEAFMGATFSYIEFSEDLKTIGDHAFAKCYSLNAITIPNGVTSIGDYAFANCYRVRTISLPRTLTELGNNCFLNIGATQVHNLSKLDAYLNTGLFQASYFEAATYYSINGFTFKIVTDEAGITLIAYDGEDENPTLPDGVTINGYQYTSYGLKILRDNASVKKLSIPKNVLVKEKGLLGFTKLEEVNFADGIAEVPAKACNGCKSLKTVTFGKSIYIRDYAFADCPSLEEIDLSDVAYLGNGAFSASGIKKAKMPNKLYAIKDYTFNNCPLEEINWPSNLAVIGNHAFYNTNLKEVNLPSTVITIGQNAFGRLKNMTSLTLNYALKSIGYCAFSDCENLEEVNIKNNITDALYYAFTNCAKLKKITLLGNIEMNDIVKGCDSLKEIVLTGQIIRLSNSTGAPTTYTESTPDEIKVKFVITSEAKVIKFGSFSKYNYIEYQGTIEEFKKIQLIDKDKYNIHCSDGDYTLE